jgi:hypothetical protein
MWTYFVVPAESVAVVNLEFQTVEICGENSGKARMATVAVNVKRSICSKRTCICYASVGQFNSFFGAWITCSIRIRLKSSFLMFLGQFQVH